MKLETRYKTHHLGEGLYRVIEEDGGAIIERGPMTYAEALAHQDRLNAEIYRQRWKDNDEEVSNQG